MYVPSTRIHDRLTIERSGLWLEEATNSNELCAIGKLPMHVIRAINAGAKPYLLIWQVTVDGNDIVVFGCRIDDNTEDPTYAYGACRNSNELEDLLRLLKERDFSLQLHNELRLPILGAKATIAPEEADSVVDRLTKLSNYEHSQSRRLRVRALDLVYSAVTARTKVDSKAILHWEIPIKLTDIVALRSVVVGTGQVSVSDTDQGAELERSAFQLFDFLCPFGAFHSPQVTYGKKRHRELCDILAVSRVRETPDEGLFVVQSKVTAVTEDTLDRTAARTAASIQKNILSALDQVEGAVRRLRAGDPIFMQNGMRVEDDPAIAELKALVQPIDLMERAGKRGHGVILVSEMHEGVDWTEVATKLIGSHSKLAFMSQVLDLQELQRLIVVSDGRPARLEEHLIRRFGLIEKYSSANVRTEVKED